jgi:hypothetical protein
VAHFTLQISPGGPLLDAFVNVSQARRTALTTAEQPIPPFMTIRALVDTGASGTCVDPSVPATLGLTPTGSASITTPSTGTTPHIADQYDISLAIPSPGLSPLVFPTIPVMCVELFASQGFHALIGRDILSRCVLHYNGATQLFTLAF